MNLRRGEGEDGMANVSIYASQTLSRYTQLCFSGWEIEEEKICLERRKEMRGGRKEMEEGVL